MAKFNEEWFYFITHYMNCTDWKNGFEKIEYFLEKPKPAKFCLIGDLNARISEEQVLDSELLIDFPYICNIRRKKVFAFIEDLDGIVLNSRTMGDFCGEFSFLVGSGNSVIDHCIVNLFMFC